jgi:hypothetical protein
MYSLDFVSLFSKNVGAPGLGRVCSVSRSLASFDSTVSRLAKDTLDIVSGPGMIFTLELRELALVEALLEVASPGPKFVSREMGA